MVRSLMMGRKFDFDVILIDDGIEPYCLTRYNNMKECVIDSNMNGEKDNDEDLGIANVNLNDDGNKNDIESDGGGVNNDDNDEDEDKEDNDDNDDNHNNSNTNNHKEHIDNSGNYVENNPPSQLKHNKSNQKDTMQPQCFYPWEKIIMNRRNKPSLTTLKNSILVSKIAQNQADDMVMLMPTSGTTGFNGMLRKRCRIPKIVDPDVLVSFSFVPLRQSLDLLTRGGCIGMSHGASHLATDLKVLRPTLFGATPIYFNQLYNQYETEFLRRKKEMIRKHSQQEQQQQQLHHHQAGLLDSEDCNNSLFANESCCFLEMEIKSNSYNNKNSDIDREAIEKEQQKQNENLKFRDGVNVDSQETPLQHFSPTEYFQSLDYKEREVEERLQNEWKERKPFGNRLTYLVVSGATFSKKVREWMMSVFECQVLDGYGATEMFRL
eukprot:Awhi_evm1s883